MVTFYEGPSPEGEGYTSGSETGRAEAPASPSETKDNCTQPDTPSTALAALEIDPSEAERFLNLLDEAASQFTFQTFPGASIADWARYYSGSHSITM